MKTNKKGISLIVLVITIIVMIILATAIILTLNSSNIVDKAKEATAASDLANAKNVVILAKGEWELMDEKQRENAGNSFVKYVESKLKAAGYDDEFISDLRLNEDGSLGKDLPKIPKGFVASIYEGETKVEDGFVIYEINSLSGVSHETAMKSYNQYVWVPVESEFVANEYEPFYSNTNDPTGEYDEYTKMKASVKANGGFYIARYEANVTGTTVSSKQGLEPWRGYWSGEQGVYNVVGTDGAVYYARSVYPESANKGAVSTLIYNVQWDAVMDFMKDVDNPNVPGKKYINDSTGMGNYEGGLAKTGSNNAYKVKNIYDMAGNQWEWTMRVGFFDVDSGNIYDRLHRGGGFEDAVDTDQYTYGEFYPANSSEAGYAMTTYNRGCGIRIALYIK